MGVGECGLFTPKAGHSPALLSVLCDASPRISILLPYNSNLTQVCGLPAVLRRMREFNVGIHLTALFVPAHVRPVYQEYLVTVSHLTARFYLSPLPAYGNVPLFYNRFRRKPTVLTVG